MLKKKFEETLALFDAYATNLAAYLPAVAGMVACPLCFHAFPRDAVFSGELSIEHIVPESIGGRLKTLTCRSCNNRHGSNLDAHLVRRVRSEDSLAQGGPIRGQVYIGDGAFKADLYISEEHFEFIGIPNLSNPELHRRAVDAIEAGPDSSRFSFSFGYKELPSMIAVLRSAYLMMFRYFGYGYVLHPNVQLIRQQILDPGKNLGVLKIITLNKPDQSPSIGVLKRPEELRCFLVNFNLSSTHVERYLGVILPSLDEAGLTVYDRWAHASNTEIETLNATVTIIPYDQAYVLDPRNKFLLMKLWKQITTGELDSAA